VHVRVAGRGEDAAALIAAQPYVGEVDTSGETIAVRMKEPMPGEAHLSQQLFEAGFALTHYEIERPTLETVFMKLTQGLVQ